MILRWFRRVLVSLDQLLNTVSGGDEDETISSRAGRQAVKGNRAAIAFCRVIGVAMGHDHCFEAIEDCECRR